MFGLVKHREANDVRKITEKSPLSHIPYKSSYEDIASDSGNEIERELVAFDEHEDKENIVDPEEMKAKKKMQEEWNLKARKHFNEALKNDRQKGEYANTMNQIKSAEMQNRREMEKNISSEKSFQAAKKQIDMEDTAEKWFKKNTKEHVIEEMVGYQDYYETKYKRIDSEFESKMIDYVPSCVKENYEYLMEDESKFLGEKNFSGLDDSGSDLLNEAYIETPPHEKGGGKIDFVIDQPDKLRSMLQTECDQTLKPLLVVSMEVPLKALSDKSVESDFFKQSGGDKAFETDIPIEGHLTPPFSNDLQRPRILYKRRREPFLPPFSEYTIPDMHQRDVHYPFPAVPLSEGLGATSWSSSSYCSLPSKHGFSNVPGSTEYCDICVAERENKLIEEEFPRSRSTLSKGMQIDSSTNKSFKTSSEKNAIAGYVQQLDEKYLESKYVSSGDLQEEDGIKSFRHCLASEKAIPEKISPTFEKEKIGKSTVDSPEGVPHKSTKMSPILETLGYSGPVLHDSDKTGNAFSKINEEKSVYVGSKKSEKYDIPNYVFGNNEAKSHEGSNNYSEYDAEVKRLQLIQQVLTRRIPLLNFNDSPKPVNQVNTEQTDLHASSFADARREMPCKLHVYHELSTIHEVDSALATSGLQLSQSKDLLDTVKKQYASLLAISSTSSSGENLSDMFSESKIVYQSAPIKSVEELAQEKGILEEPDLTLLTTQLTGMPDSLELPRDLSYDPANLAPINMNLEKGITLLASPSESQIPTNLSPKLSGCADTPSMISFLHHEMICLQEENSPIKDENCSPEAPKTQKVQKNQEFPRVEYKQQTKRLWNNLEEVKKKNLAEERQKVLSANRLKAKEYAKKLIPKKKAN